MNKVLFSENNIEIVLNEVLSSIKYDKLFVLVDETTLRLCLPQIANLDAVKIAHPIIIGSTDSNKTIESLAYVWKELSDNGGTRHSLLLNLGGGMVTDLGGFAASTFKRGIRYVNIPTTLLSMVDASVGGKTGINYNGLKNEVGVFNDSQAVIIDTIFLKTLDKENILSGYAEMMKHGLISTTSTFNDVFDFDFTGLDMEKNQKMISDSISVKQDIVEQDHNERGIRKALNLGHTAGHAFESWALTRIPCLHGYAVAWGLICELFLSNKKCGLPFNILNKVSNYVVKNYGLLAIQEHDFEELYGHMTHDKKNEYGKINFTLLSNIGDIKINQYANKEDIYEMLNYYASLRT